MKICYLCVYSPCLQILYSFSEFSLYLPCIEIAISQLLFITDMGFFTRTEMTSHLFFFLCSCDIISVFVESADKYHCIFIEITICIFLAFALKNIFLAKEHQYKLSQLLQFAPLAALVLQTLYLS